MDVQPPPELAGWSRLTRAQQRAAALAASGLPNPEIARQLEISRGTVKSHLAAAYHTLGVANRIELAIAVARAQQHDHSRQPRR